MKHQKLFPLLIVVAALLAYQNSFRVPFIFDDVVTIVENPTIRQLWPPWQALSPPTSEGSTVQGRPLLNLSLAVNYALGGTKVWGYHVVNLAIHILAGLTLYGIVRRTLLWPKLRDQFDCSGGLPPRPLGLSLGRVRPPRTDNRSATVSDLAQSSTEDLSSQNEDLRSRRRRGRETGAEQAEFHPSSLIPHHFLSSSLALAVALLWTLHPLQTEAVTYTIQRAESLVGLFYLLTLYCFIRGAESPSGFPHLWSVLSVVACLLGMATKELMATAPLLVLLYDRAFVAGTFREAWRRRWGFYLALAGTWLLWAWCVLGAQNLAMQQVVMKERGITRWGYLLTEPGVILHYLRLAFWPQRLCFDYVGWPLAASLSSVWPSVIVVGVLVGATAWALKKNSVWGFLGAWFFVILAPTSSFFPLDSPVYEHRLYLPLAAVVAAVAVGIYRLAGTRMLSGVAVLAVGLGLLTWERNQDYRSELAIWTDTAAKRPDNFRAHNNLGALYAQQGNFEEATRHLLLVLKYRPNDAEAHANLGTIYFNGGQLPAAVEHLEAALRADPRLLPARLVLGVALARLGRRAEAVQAIEELVRLDPGNQNARSLLAALTNQRTATPPPENPQ